MNDIAHTLYNIVQYILGFGPTVMLPLVLFILALFFKVKPAKALRSSLTVGIGFVGIYAIFDILTSNVGPAAQAMVERTGINLPVVDLGCTAAFRYYMGFANCPVCYSPDYSD
ncbi:hypothetical protein ECO2947_01410 [Escherichia coli]|nr:hypothetical protein ECO2947_01410 [Escherichia coli]